MFVRPSLQQISYCTVCPFLSSFGCGHLERTGPCQSTHASTPPATSQHDTLSRLASFSHPPCRRREYPELDTGPPYFDTYKRRSQMYQYLGCLFVVSILTRVRSTQVMYSYHIAPMPMVILGGSGSMSPGNSQGWAVPGGVDAGDFRQDRIPTKKARSTLNIKPPALSVEEQNSQS